MASLSRTLRAVRPSSAAGPAVGLAVAPALAVVLAMGGSPSWVAAQPAFTGERGFAVVGEADALVDAGRVEEGLELLEDHLVRRPGDYPARWRAARAALALGVLAGNARPRERDAWLERAIDHGEEAVEREPRGIDGLYWRAAAKGRRALHAGARQAADLGEQVWDEAHRILEMDPEHPGAHNALGRLNLEIMILPGWKRTLGRLVAGGALGRASWEAAEEHLERAVALDPDQILYLRDLGQLYLRTDRPERARRVLEQVVAMPPGRPADEVFLDEARSLLRSLQEEAGGG